MNYYTYRAIKGHVWMKLTDVSINGGARWYSALYWINLIDSTGHVWSDTFITKDWGVPAPYKQIATIPSGKSVRMCVTAQVTKTDGYGLFNTWTANLQWDNLNVQ
ncbi:MAG: hypothetical protein BGN95_24650 [Sphingomonas sp. 66-10]|nr:MAG: hypothetical protein BGN95_24650 [Sphingomonas sp. 66-10]